MTAPDLYDAIREALESVDPSLFNADYADAQDAAVARLMEDYAAERVREALNEAADAIEDVGAAPEYAVELIEAIRDRT